MTTRRRALVALWIAWAALLATACIFPSSLEEIGSLAVLGSFIAILLTTLRRPE